MPVADEGPLTVGLKIGKRQHRISPEQHDAFAFEPGHAELFVECDSGGVGQFYFEFYEAGVAALGLCGGGEEFFCQGQGRVRRGQRKGLR